MPARISLFAFLSLSPLAIAQQTLVVGAGQPFPTIAAAVAVAQAGDTVLVQPGSHDVDVVIDKGIRLVGAPGALLRQPLFTFDGITVQGLPAGETFVMTGFSVDAASTIDVGLAAIDCAGQVVLRHLQQGGLRLFRVVATNSQQVHIAEGIVRAAVFTDSTVVLERILVDPSSFFSVTTTGGVTVFDTCSINANTAIPGVPAIAMNGGRLAITRSTVTSSQSGLAAISTTGGVVLLDPTTTVGAAGGPGVSGTAAVVTVSLRSLKTRYDEPGSALELENHGVAGELVVTVMSLPAPPFETPLGIAWVDPLQMEVVHAAVLPPSRLDTVSLPLPPLPSGLAVALQTVSFDAGTIALSSPSLVAVD